MINAERLAIAVMAAGQSRRFGTQDKLIADFRGKPMIMHVCDTLRAFDVQKRWLVTSADNRIEVEGFESIVNPKAAQGLGTSVALAARHAGESGAAALLVALADMPLVPQAHFSALIAQSAQNPLVATHTGERALPPAIFGKEHFAHLMALSGDTGARDLLAQAQTVSCDPDLLIDIDTQHRLDELSGL